MFDKILLQIFLFGLNGDFLEHYFTNNSALKSELRTLTYTYLEENFAFFSDNGVFSKDKIDFGSRLLVETILKQNLTPNQKILDIGCGYGFMGIVLGKILKSQVTFSDINKRALHLTERNIIKNKIRGSSIESNVYENIQEKFDLVITNPPIRAGKDIVLKILKESKKYLNSNGSLWCVIRKDQGAKSIQKELAKIGICEIVEKSKGFYVMKSEFS